MTNTRANSIGIGVMLIIALIIILCTSCGVLTPMTEKEKELEYKIDKLYLEYSYQRDSLIIEYNNTKNIK